MSDADRERSKSRRVAAKEAWAVRKRATLGRLEPRSPRRDRLPPGQRWVDKWPVLDLGDQPEIDRQEWRLAVDGAVEEPFEIDFDKLMAMPQTELSRDFHCVTTWSTQDKYWRGVRFAEFMDRAIPKADATHVLLTGYDKSPDGENYTTNLPLADCLDDDVLIVHQMDGRALTREHGAPVRMIVPKLYAWKSAKWLRGITILAGDRPGFWEARGYSDSAKPWENDRFRDGPPASYELE